MARPILTVAGMKLRRTKREVWPEASGLMNRLIGHVLEVQSVRKNVVLMQVLSGQSYSEGAELPVPARFVNDVYFECLENPSVAASPAPPAAFRTSLSKPKPRRLP